MGLQDDRDLPPVKDDASDDTETSSGGVNKKRHLNMYDLVSFDIFIQIETINDRQYYYYRQVDHYN